MKKIIITICVAILTASIVQAQGNLQFNQVIKQTFSLGFNGNTPTTMGTLTVPTGKVYKIESATMMYGDLYPHYSPVTIGDQFVWIAPDSPVDLFPLWLPEGSYPIVFKGLTYSEIFNLSISAIEFNVVP